MSVRNGLFTMWAGIALAVAAMIPGGWALAEEAGDVYTLDTCPVSGMKLGDMGEPVVKTYDGREIRFCCEGCPAKFEADSSTYLEKIDATLIEQQKPWYPLTTCLVAGGVLGSKGDPVDHIYQNRLVRVGCQECLKKLKEDPAGFISELDKAAIEQQKDSYPLSTCAVSGEKLGGDMGPPIDYVVGNRLVRFCCKGCVKKFEKAPAKYLSALDDAGVGKQMEMPAEGSHSGHGEHKH